MIFTVQPTWFWDINYLFHCLGEGEEIHASSGQPESARHRKKLHVQQTCVCHL